MVFYKGHHVGLRLRPSLATVDNSHIKLMCHCSIPKSSMSASLFFKRSIKPDCWTRSIYLRASTCILVKLLYVKNLLEKVKLLAR